MLLINHKSKNKAEMVEKRNWHCGRERKRVIAETKVTKIYSDGVGGASCHSLLHAVNEIDFEEAN